MARKRARPTIVATIHETTDTALRARADGQWGRMAAIVDAALRAYLGLPAEVEGNGSRVKAVA